MVVMLHEKPGVKKGPWALAWPAGGACGQAQLVAGKLSNSQAQV